MYEKERTHINLTILILLYPGKHLWSLFCRNAHFAQP